MNILFTQQTTSDNYSIRRYIETAKEMGHKLDFVRYSELSVQFSDSSDAIITHKGEDVIKKYDIFIGRKSTDFKTGNVYAHYSRMIKYLANKNGKVSLNFNNIKNHYHKQTKIYNYAVLMTAGVPVINTWIFSSLEDAKAANLTFPKIVKPAQGSLGKGVELIKSFEELEKYLEETSAGMSEIVIQEFIEASEERVEDVRILALGNEILGGMIRYAEKEKIISNFSAGGSVEYYKPSEEVIEIVGKVMKSMDLDYAGIDIIFKNGKPFVLEVNNAPQFEGFESVNDVNVPKKVIQYLVDKAIATKK